MRNESGGFEDFADRPLGDIFHELGNIFSVLNVELDVLEDSEVFSEVDRQNCRQRTLRAKVEIESKAETFSRSTDEQVKKLSDELLTLLSYDWDSVAGLKTIVAGFKDLHAANYEKNIILSP
jgi:hypothetical protein